MKLLQLLFFCTLCAQMGYSQKTNENYDEKLATELGADEYGMKSYVFVLLKTGTNTDDDKAKRDSCFAGHMANMGVMEEAGQLVIAGPMGKNDDDIRGIFILNVPTVEAAAELLKTDPAINEKYLEPIIMPWYGSAAIPTYLPNSDKVWKTGF